MWRTETRKAAVTHVENAQLTTQKEAHLSEMKNDWLKKFLAAFKDSSPILLLQMQRECAQPSACPACRVARRWADLSDFKRTALTGPTRCSSGLVETTDNGILG